MKRLTALLTAVCLMAVLFVPCAAADGTVISYASNTPSAENERTELSMTNLRSIMMKYNTNILSLDAQITNLGTTDSTQDAIDDSISSLYDMSFSMQQAYDNALALQASYAMLGNEEFAGIYGTLAVCLGAQIATLTSQSSQLETQSDNLGNTIDSSVNTLQAAINQIIKGGESLYIGILSMETSVPAVERGIATLERAVTICEVQNQVGLASDYQLETMNYQLTSAKSQLEDLQFQIQSSKVTLEGLCGMALNGTVTLTAPVFPTEKELAAVDYSKEVSNAAAKNADVRNARLELISDNSDENRKAYQAAVDTFASGFKVTCDTVADKSRLVKTAQQALELQKRTFKIAELQYSLGLSSREDYLSAQDELTSAEESVYSAQLNLLSAYRSYYWAVQYGLAE